MNQTTERFAAERISGETAPVSAHGGRLISRAAGEQERARLAKRAGSLPQIRLTQRQMSDLELISVGAFSPLEGFMGKADYQQVVHEMRLASGLVWTLPVTLAVEDTEAASLPEGGEAALVAEDGSAAAILEGCEKFGYDKRREARLVYGTEDENHPGVAALYSQGEVLVGGKVTTLALPSTAGAAGPKLTPAETRRFFADKGWRRVVGFQTRNPIHRAHEYLQKCVLEMADGLLIHPLVGETKGDDIPSEVRLRCYQTLIENYFPQDRVLLSVWPAAMRYAGPREAVFHAIVRKNYGCTHFIVGRDHAGVGNYYGTYDAQYIFDEFDSEELGITPVFFEHAFFCRICDAMATAKTCPHDEAHRVALSGTRVREMLARGEAPPEEFTRPEIARILLEAAGQVVCEGRESKRG
jgi:sulfate adenylyltransferase